MPQKEQTDMWIEGVEPAPQPNIRKSRPQPKVTGRQKMERFRMPLIPNMSKQLGPKVSKA